MKSKSLTLFVTFLLYLNPCYFARADSNNMLPKADTTSVQQLEEAAKNSPPKDKAAYQKLIKAMKQKDKDGKAAFKRTLKAEETFIEEMTKLHSDDKVVLFSLILSEYGLGLSTKTEVDKTLAKWGKKHLKTAQTKALKFVKKYPKYAPAHLLVARTCENASLAQREAKKCLKLDPSNKACEEFANPGIGKK